jgi:protein gp37
MNHNSKIEWTTTTWNPVTGCSKISSGCLNCYAEKFALRLKAIGCPSYRNGFKVTLHEDKLRKPLETKKGRMIFVNSMSDLFHEKVPTEFILKIFKIMNEAHWHIFQVLTKRSQRLFTLSQKLPWASNIWMGVTVENMDCSYRIDHLRQTRAKIKFLSCEPFLGPLSGLDLTGIDWVIAGGESGPRARLMEKSWVLDLRDQCFMKKIPFFFKQWGGTNRAKTGRLLEGKIYDGMPLLETNDPHYLFQ